MRRQELDAVYVGPLGVVFTVLCRTLSFRRWPPVSCLRTEGIPAQGERYLCQSGTVRRAGRVVEVMRPVGLTLKEVLHDPPCRVSLTLRWRVDPLARGCRVRLGASYRLNHAAVLRAAHWDRRLEENFRRQLAFLALNLERMQDAQTGEFPLPVKRDLSH